MIMGTAEHKPEALDLVVRADGSGVVDAAQLARLGVTPGSHLAVVPTGVPVGRKRNSQDLWIGVSCDLLIVS